MKTERLFDRNPYQYNFEAEILSQSVQEDGCHVILDQTCFYPEGGGQPCDQGELNGQKVLHVFEKDDVIVHILPESVENPVIGHVNPDLRMDHMQQHSGQHVLSRAIYELYHGETIGFHLGESVSTIDLNLPELNDAQISEIEKQANEIVLLGKPLITRQLTPEEARELPLRKDPVQKTMLRIVEVDGFDWSACCGTHCRNSGEIGLIKIIKTERYKGGVRVSFLCGQRAFRDYQSKHFILRDICQQLSVSETDLSNKIQILLRDKKETAKKMKDLMQRSTSFEAEALLKNAEKQNDIQIVFSVDSVRTQEMLSILTRKCIENSGTLVFLGSQSTPSAMVVARSRDLDLDLKTILSPLIEEQQLKGGGRPDWMQLTGQSETDVKMVLGSARSQIMAALPSR